MTYDAWKCGAYEPCLYAGDDLPDDDEETMDELNLEYMTTVQLVSERARIDAELARREVGLKRELAEVRKARTTVTRRRRTKQDEVTT